MKIISWNLAGRQEPWHTLMEMGADIALLQEAGEPPTEVTKQISVDAAPWMTVGAGKTRHWRTAVVKLSDEVEVKWHKPIPIADAGAGELCVSRLGTIAAATVTPSSGEPFIVISMYAMWERPHTATGSSWIMADASAHRLISDLSVFIGRQTKHRIIASGDLNILYGYGEEGNNYWAGRYATIFDRMAAMGIPFIGPQAPLGRQAEPWPEELPRSSQNVPTFHSNRMTPDSASRQLDFVFASDSLAGSLKVTALNKPDEWGPSDHCRVVIDFK